MRKLIIATALAIPAIAALAPVAASAKPAVAVCRDSNGSRPGGSVYVADGRALGCDMVAPQQLHVTRVQSAARCADMGGHAWTARTKVCWRVDY